MLKNMSIIGETKESRKDNPKKNIYYYLIQTPYGVCKVAKNDFDPNKIPTILSAIDKTEYLKNQAKEKYGTKYRILSPYLNSKTKLDIECENLHIFHQTSNLFLNKAYCDLCHKNSKQFKLEKEINELNEIISKYNYKIIDKIKEPYEYSYGTHKAFYKYFYIIETPYGLCKQKCESLKNDHLLTIQSAINQTEYFQNQSNNIHNFKYKILDEYSNSSDTKYNIYCPDHGIFQQLYTSHINSKNGCPSCSYLYTGWNKTNFKNACDKNNSGLGIFYIIKCFNDSEEFYKLGITSRSVKKRYSSNNKLPYQYKIIQEIEDLSDSVWNLEITLKKYITKNNFKYKPLIYFEGSSTECYKI